MTTPETITVPAEVMLAYVELQRAAEKWRNDWIRGGRHSASTTGKIVRALDRLERVSPVCGG